MAKNYYTILGVLPDATAEDIRGAYRKRAKELHPDHYGENSSPFLEVQEAYGVLSNPGHRRNYDRSLRKSRPHAGPSEIEPLRPASSRVEPLRSAGEPVNFGEIDLQGSFQTVRPSIEEVFDRLRSHLTPTSPYKSERLQNLCMEITLTADEARRGGRMEIVLPSQSVCPTCGGQGAVEPYQCFRCMGSGTVYGDAPVIVEYGPGISDGYQKAISLRRLGILDVYVTLLFRVSGIADIEDL